MDFKHECWPKLRIFSPTRSILDYFTSCKYTYHSVNCERVDVLRVSGVNIGVFFKGNAPRVTCLDHAVHHVRLRSELSKYEQVKFDVFMHNLSPMFGI